MKDYYGELWFPNPEEATKEGLLALGGDLSMARLLLAYRSGIFPWYTEGDPIMWYSPDPRMILFPEKFKVLKSLRKTLRSDGFSITFNERFEEVIAHCASVKRAYQKTADTWITPEMIDAYTKLHKAGHAMSVEVWQDDKLVGGLYGIDLPEKRVFCGESMFSLVSDASKVALFHLTTYCRSKNYKFIDCQLHNAHLESLGAEVVDRDIFLKWLKD